MYTIKTDLHIHTLATPHAYSTVAECAKAASDAGLECIAITDHAPSMPDAPHIFHFLNFGAIPREVCGVKMLMGAEVNLVSHSGEIDLDEKILKKLDIVIASAHTVCLEPGGLDENTEMYMAAAKNDLIDIIGHCGDERFKFDYDAVLEEFVKRGKIVEVNDHSFVFRPGSGENCRRIIRTVKKLGGMICVNTDAHYCAAVGRFENAIKALKDEDFPEDKIANLNFERVKRFILAKKGIDI